MDDFADEPALLYEAPMPQGRLLPIRGAETVNRCRGALFHGYVPELRDGFWIIGEPLPLPEVERAARYCLECSFTPAAGFLYVLCDRRGRIFYVGITNRVARFTEHARRSLARWRDVADHKLKASAILYEADRYGLGGAVIAGYADATSACRDEAALIDAIGLAQLCNRKRASGSKGWPEARR